MPRKVKLPADFQLDDARLWEKKGQTRTLVREYRLVTPLFGGGVEPRYADPVTVVRASEIKGHLRFWWRALCGWQAGQDLKKLLTLEEGIWGGVTESKTASSVALQVEALNKGEEEPPFEYVPGRPFPPKNKADVAPGYFAFPLQPTKNDPTLYPVRRRVRFKLSLTYLEEHEKAVHAALWAWETFGGIGARTRRGFGAVVPEGFNPPTVGEIQNRLKDLIKGDRWPEGVPHLRPGSLLYLYPHSWQGLAKAYKDFRQWRNNGHGNGSGRSKWPEPDEIRRITHTHSPGHEPKHRVRKFPRGQFGLPIVFHFKDEKQGDPPDVTLKGEGIERLASPLGFKPLGERGPVLVYVLEGSRKLTVPYVLETRQGSKQVQVQVDLTTDEARSIEPLKIVGGETDPILAFVNWLKQGGRK